jgi:uncharacterized protein (UPF0332 family)
MRFAWSGFLLVAQSLADEPGLQGEGRTAQYRTAISRAYYAVFGTAKAHLQDDLGFKVATRNTHADVRGRIRELGQTNDVYDEVAVKLERLRKNRVLADYKAEWPPDQDLTDVARAAIQSAGHALAALGTVRTPPDDQDVTETSPASRT